MNTVSFKATIEQTKRTMVTIGGDKTPRPTTTISACLLNDNDEPFIEKNMNIVGFHHNDDDLRKVGFDLLKQLIDDCQMFKSSM